MGKKYLDTKETSLESSILGVWAEAAKKVAETNKNDKSDDGKGLDAVQPKAVKKKFDDRKDKDIDNDGDTDSSDEFLHKKRKAISKAMKDEGNAFGKALKDAKEKGEKTFVVAGKTYEVKEESGLDEEGLEDSPNKANSQHLCAKNVVHEEWGEGQPVHGMHAIPNSDGDIAWYDVMFEHGIEKGVSINELKVRAAESHHDHGGKKSKKEGAMKRGKDLDTFKPKDANEEFQQHQEFKVQSMRDALEKVWKGS